MWCPNKSQQVDKPEAALITRAYEDLLFDDGPVLFTGLGAQQERIVGSSVEREEGIDSYLHGIVDGSAFEAFTKREISYPELLRRARKLFLVHWTDEPSPNVYSVRYEDIPEDYRPDEAAFCPALA